MIGWGSWPLPASAKAKQIWQKNSLTGEGWPVGQFATWSLAYWWQRRTHSLSGCANLDSTPVLLGGTGVYHQPQSHYCSWSWNWVCLLSCGLGWNPLLSTPFCKFRNLAFKADLQPVKIAILFAFLYWAWRKEGEAELLLWPSYICLSTFLTQVPNKKSIW